MKLVKPFSITRYLFIILIIISMPELLVAQLVDSSLKFKIPEKRNIIKFNPTPSILFSEYNITFSYERILNHKNSYTVSTGYFVFPKIFGDTVANMIHFTNRDRFGYSISAEYRRYLLSRNARPVPDGVYLAPFASHYGYYFTNDFDIMNTPIDSSGQMKGNLYIFNVGIALGYQFVFKNNFTIDLVLMGPSISYYGGKVNINGKLKIEDLQNINEDLYNKLLDRYPTLGDIIIDKTFVNEGKIDILSIGYRYMIQIGYCF